MDGSNVLRKQFKPTTHKTLSMRVAGGCFYARSLRAHKNNRRTGPAWTDLTFCVNNLSQQRTNLPLYHIRIPHPRNRMKLWHMTSH